MLNVFFKLIGDFFTLLFQFILSLFYHDKSKYKDAWLFCERGIDAGDNAYHLFKYVCQNHPEIKSYYIVDYNNKKAYQKVKKVGKTIDYNSFEHKIAFMISKVYVCTHYGYITQCNYRLYKYLFNKNKKYIFLQHGIIKDDLSKEYNNLVLPLNVFVTSTKDEYLSIINNKNYGYSKEVLKLTGLPRFDNLYNKKSKKQILFMPTWRNYLAPLDGKIDENKFLKSEYYKSISQILNDNKLHKFLIKQDIKFIFYPHHEIQRYINLFKTNCKNIIIAKEKNYDVQKLLIDSAFLVTDYSSIFFDFAYMKKPLIYFQFDKEIFQKKHYNSGYFTYEKKGFGPVVLKYGDVINYIIKSHKKNFLMEDKYVKRVENTFKYNDKKNCQRVFNEILDSLE